MVGKLRALESAYPLFVGGDAAAFHDERAAIGSHVAIAIALLAAATLLILFMLSGSVVGPLLSLLMTALTLAAAFGALILIFQDGRFERLLGSTSQGAPDLTIPLVLAALVFAISTDHGVFLLSRVRVQHRAEPDAIGGSVATVGRIVTSVAFSSPSRSASLAPRTSSSSRSSPASPGFPPTARRTGMVATLSARAAAWAHLSARRGPRAPMSRRGGRVRSFQRLLLLVGRVFNVDG